MPNGADEVIHASQRVVGIFLFQDLQRRADPGLAVAGFQVHQFFDSVHIRIFKNQGGGFAGPVKFLGPVFGFKFLYRLVQFRRVI